MPIKVTVDANGLTNLIRCPNCQIGLRLKVKNTDKNLLRVKCPKCAHSFEIESNSKTRTASPLANGTVLRGHDNWAEYTIQRVLGQGSFGYTYEATGVIAEKYVKTKNGYKKREALPLHPVAIKEFFMKEIMLRNSDGTVDLQLRNMAKNHYDRFEKEARMLYKMMNDHVVSIYDHFEANNTAYYVMELIDGIKMSEWQPESLEDAIDAILQIGYGLEYLHTKGFLHLDVKPDNIMRRRDGTWVLIDFGLCVRIKDDTSTIVLGGSPSYAPMEQLFGRSQRNVAMDVYGLGAVLYRLVLGETPPTSVDLFNDGFPFSKFEQKKIPYPFRNIIAKAMSPKASERFQSIRQMLRPLRWVKITDFQINDNLDTPAPSFSDSPRKRIKEFDNLWERTMSTGTINGINYRTDLPETIDEHKALLKDMVPCSSGHITRHLHGNLSNVYGINNYIHRLQTGLNIQIRLANVEEFKQWCEDNPTFVEDPILLFDEIGASLYRARADRRLPIIEKIDLANFDITEEFLFLLVADTVHTPYEFDPVRWYYGFHPVCDNGKWGMIRNDKRIVIPCEFESVSTVRPIWSRLYAWRGLGVEAQTESKVYLFGLTSNMDMEVKASVTLEEWRSVQRWT